MRRVLWIIISVLTCNRFIWMKIILKYIFILFSSVLWKKDALSNNIPINMAMKLKSINKVIQLLVLILNTHTSQNPTKNKDELTHKCIWGQTPAYFTCSQFCLDINLLRWRIKLFFSITSQVKWLHFVALT